MSVPILPRFDVCGNFVPTSSCTDGHKWYCNVSDCEGYRTPLSFSQCTGDFFFSQAANGQNSDAAILVYTREFLSLRQKVPKVHDVGLSDIRTKNKKRNKRL